MGKIILEIDKEKFVSHIQRICRSNIRKPCKICLVCPFRKDVLKIMKEKGWKLPAKEEKNGEENDS